MASVPYSIVNLECMVADIRRDKIVILHLTTIDVWTRQRDQETYVPEPFESEGFIHCTLGHQNVIDVGNRYYTSDSRQFICLLIEEARVTSEIRYEDPAGIFPHIYGPLNLDSVTSVRAVVRDSDGRFERLGDEISA
jgi:uncharacterized protein (DUF952 family)